MTIKKWKVLLFLSWIQFRCECRGFRFQANGLTVEEFQHSLQEVTNFPLRSFVLPFLRDQLPALQRQLHSLAKAAGEVSRAFPPPGKQRLH